jgi:phospholipid-binding lipoprotein MlaA
VKRSLGLTLLLAFLAVGCAHDPNRASSLEPSQTPPSQIKPAPIASNPERIAPKSTETKAVSRSKGVAAKEIPAAAQVNAGEDKGDYGDVKEEDEGDVVGKEGLADAEGKEGDAERATIADPIEPVNRAMYTFNDKLYFWVLKPVAQGYNVIAPEGVRVSLRNFFSNLGFPTRFVNCLLQVDLKCLGTELGRFVINSTLGFAGFFDPASLPEINLQKQDVDFGQTLGVYGVGHGFYIIWPVLGPSSPRDSVGIIGEYFLYPVSYINPWYLWLAVRSYQEMNDTSLKIGDYESLKEAAIDPYIAIRDAYVQYRQKKVKERGSQTKASQVRGSDVGELTEH